MANPKVLELIVRARDQARAEFRGTAASVRGLTNDLRALERQYEAQQNSRRSLTVTQSGLGPQRRRLLDEFNSPTTAPGRQAQISRELLQVEKQRKQVAAEIRGSIERESALRSQMSRLSDQTLQENRVRLMEREAALGDEAAERELARTRLVRQQRAERADLLRILRSQAATDTQRTEAQRQINQLTSVQRREVEATARGVREKVNAEASATVERAATESLERRAQLGDREARQQLELLRLRRRNTAEAQRLESIIRNGRVDQRHKINAQRQLNELKRVERLEEQRIANMNRRRLFGGGRNGASSLARGVAYGAGSVPGLGYAASFMGGGLGGGAMAAGLGGGLAVAGYASAVKTAANFEYSMSRTLALTQATNGEFDALRAKAELLGRTTVFNPIEISGAMSNLALAGFKVDEILQSIKPSLDLAAAGQIDLGEATKITSRIMAGMGIPASHVGDAVDVLVKAFTTANTNLSELGTAFEYVGPVARLVGYDLAETASILQVLADRGMAGEKGGTVLRQVLIKLANPTAEAKKLLDELGITTKNAEGNFRPLVDIVEEFTDKVSHLGTQEQLAAYGTVFEARGGAGFAGIVGAGADEIRDNNKALNDFGGTADRMASTQLNNLQGSVVKLTSAWTGLKISIGESNGMIRATTDSLTGMIGAATNLMDQGSASALLFAPAILQGKFIQGFMGNDEAPASLPTGTGTYSESDFAAASYLSRAHGITLAEAIERIQQQRAGSQKSGATFASLREFQYGEDVGALVEKSRQQDIDPVTQINEAINSVEFIRNKIREHMPELEQFDKEREKWGLALTAWRSDISRILDEGNNDPALKQYRQQAAYAQLQLQQNPLTANDKRLTDLEGERQQVIGQISSEGRTDERIAALRDIDAQIAEQISKSKTLRDTRKQELDSIAAITSLEKMRTGLIDEIREKQRGVIEEARMARMAAEAEVGSDEDKARLAETLARQGFDARIKSLKEITTNSNTPADQRRSAQSEIDRLTTLSPQLAQRAGDDVRARAADDRIAIEDRLYAMRYDLIQRQIASGREELENEREKMRIERESLITRRELQKILDDEKTTAQQRAEAENLIAESDRVKQEQLAAIGRDKTKAEGIPVVDVLAASNMFFGDAHAAIAQRPTPEAPFDPNAFRGARSFGISREDRGLSVTDFAGTQQPTNQLPIDDSNQEDALVKATADNTQRMATMLEKTNRLLEQLTTNLQPLSDDDAGEIIQVSIT